MGVLFSWTLVAHLTGIVMWVGGLLAATMSIAQDAREAASFPVPARAADSSAQPDLQDYQNQRQAAHAAYTRLAQRLMRALAHPGLALAVASGVGLLLQLPSLELRMAWLQIKLGLAVAMIFLDWMITRQARRMEKSTPSRKLAMRLHMLVATVFIVILMLVLVQP